jgi:ATP/maltotriose-dependent transcriptional regulator MalT
LAFQWSVASRVSRQIDVADHLVDGAETELGHDFAHFHGDEGHEIDHVLGLAGEVLAQLRILGGDADRAGVLLADAHHQAADGNQRRGGESVFLGT